MATRNHIPIPDNLPAKFWGRFDARTERRGRCLEWTGHTRNRKKDGRYGAAKLPGGRNVFAHRLAWTRANGQIPNGLCVLHSCDNPLCVDPAHLFLGDDAANAADRERKGRNRPPIGEDQGRARLTNEQVRRIRFLLANGVVQKIIAAAYRVCPATVAHIATGRNWSKIT